MSELILALCCVGGAFGTYFTCNALKNKNIRIGKREIVASNLVLWSLAFLLFAAMIFAIYWWIDKSSFGRVLKALREDEKLTQIMGYKTKYYKSVIFVNLISQNPSF